MDSERRHSREINIGHVTNYRTPVNSAPPSPVQERLQELDYQKCRCLPRDVACLSFYVQAVVSLVVLVVGIYGWLGGVGDEGDKCTFVGLITTIVGLWLPSPIHSAKKAAASGS